MHKGKLTNVNPPRITTEPQQLANKIWASANKMRSKIEANEYKDYILGLIFYKFLSDNEENYLKSIGWTDEDIVTLVEDYENQEAVIHMISSAD